ncbi:MAG: NDP-sugar synthase [Candidatus Margulisbacteria bacterium]|nr:NDP-sugar synthase [Candidatus Margulisiibacteriota bacterium]MBU1616655.1 NDP-sugar synthase [Candidatus Margulisiibacteriota bacterium]MBU1867646.1 NDP-sugar synthase [Candidatus Margulisiibacteriota bacterium]
MKALIMAAGYGTRMEPLTLAVPKPMTPIVNLPTMQHNIELLKRWGFEDLTANIHYHPEQIENYFGDGYNFGVNLNYSYEEELLGTAGGVKRMGEEIARINEEFLVLSSDALTDVNLQRLVEFHKSKGALATIALARVDNVSEFGVVLHDEEGHITGFQEKPSQEEAKNDLVNTGIYVFEPEVLKMIPAGFFDFGKQLFPELISKKAPVYGYNMVEYWSDVGGLDKYIQSNYDAMKGLVQIRIPGNKKASSTWVGERERIDPSARFEGSVIIGDRCSIGKDVYIKDAVIGDKCVIRDGAVVTGSVLWSDVIVSSGSAVSDSVIGNFSYVGENVKVPSGSVIANRSVIRSGSTLQGSLHLKPNSII